MPTDRVNYLFVRESDIKAKCLNVELRLTNDGAAILKTQNSFLRQHLQLRIYFFLQVYFCLVIRKYVCFCKSPDYDVKM